MYYVDNTGETVPLSDRDYDSVEDEDLKFVGWALRLPGLKGADLGAWLCTLEYFEGRKL